MEELRTTKKSGNSTKLIALVVGGLLLLGVGFASGIAYQKGAKTTSTTAATGQALGQYSTNGGFGGRAGRLGGFGTVSAVSSSSITVNNQRTGTDQIYSITSSTTITNNGATAAVTDIKTGDTVIVRADTSDATKAASIALNPQIPSGGFGPGGQSGAAPQAQSN